jgi:PAS domain S-box-containing protein
MMTPPLGRTQEADKRCAAAHSGVVAAATDQQEGTACLYEELFRGAATMMFVVRSDGSWVALNPAGLELLGSPGAADALPGEPLAVRFVSRDDWERLRNTLESEDSVADHEARVTAGDGREVMLSFTAQRSLRADGTVLYHGLARDVTRVQQWRDSLVEIDERNRSLNEHILRMLMVMSHDIRGPLIAMAATLKLLMRSSFGAVDPSVKNVLNDLMVRVVRLLGTAEDCLGKASSVEGSLRVERQVLDLRQDIIDPILDEISEDIQQAGIVIDNRLGAIPAGVIQIRADRIWLKTVFRNLFRNAIKYGGRGCTIAFGFEDHGGYYRLNVYNSGTPVAEEHRGRLFTQFGRIRDGAHGARDGVGLGLYLISEIIEKHGGSIWYEAKPEGSDFVFTLPKEETVVE